MIIAPVGFQDDEFFEPMTILEKAGHDITIASLKKGPCKGAHGSIAVATVALAEVNTNDYAAVIFVGGGGSSIYFDDRIALLIAREMNADGKIVAAICLAPVILANAGVLKGKNATVWPDESKTIESKGAKYAGTGVVVDGKIVTGDGPKAAREFGRKILSLI